MTYPLVKKMTIYKQFIHNPISRYQHYAFTITSLNYDIRLNSYVRISRIQLYTHCRHRIISGSCILFRVQGPNPFVPSSVQFFSYSYCPIIKFGFVHNQGILYYYIMLSDYVNISICIAYILYWYKCFIYFVLAFVFIYYYNQYVSILMCLYQYIVCVCTYQYIVYVLVYSICVCTYQYIVYINISVCICICINVSVYIYVV